MSEERLIVCHGADGKPCARATEAECLQLVASSKGHIIRSRKGQIVRLMLNDAACGRVCIGWRGGSRTQTQRIRNERREIIAPPCHVEFKPLIYSTPQG